MAAKRRDLSFVFQPVIHEPLSKPEVLQNGVDEGLVENGDSSPSEPHEEQEKQGTEFLESMREAFHCKVQHPRKAMSLFLKSGKGLVLAGDEEAALECFESLILLAKEQLTHVLDEKAKLPPLTPQERAHIHQRRPLRREDSVREENEPKELDGHGLDEPHPRQPSLVNGTNQKQASECMENGLATVIQIDQGPATPQSTTTPAPLPQEQIVTVEDCVVEGAEVIHACDESDMFIVREESASFCFAEAVVEEQFVSVSENETSDMTVGGSSFNSSVDFCEAVVQDSLQDSVSCAAELTQEMQVCVVDYTESAGGEFEVALLDSSDDNVSVCSLGSTENYVQTHDIVMECGEQMVEEVPISPLQKALIRRGYVVSELIDTEQSYVQDLGYVVKGYIPEFSTSNLPVELKNKEREVFSNLQDIYEWHSRELNKELKDCEDEPERIGEVFAQSEQQLEELYSEYCRNKLKSASLVQKYTDSFFLGCKEKLGHRLQLADYLIKPVQRITKYQLLLKDILKHTERAGEDASELQKGLEVALRILKRTNDMVNVGMLQGFEVKPEETGDLILQEEFMVVDGKAKVKGKERRVFLFEKVLIFSEPMTREGGLPAYRYVHNMKTKGLGQTESVDSDPCKWAVWLRKLGSAEIFLLKASCPEVKETWIKAIKECHERKRPGLLKAWYKYRSRGSEEKEDSTDGMLRTRTARQGGNRRTTVKRKTSKTGKKRGREMSASEKLKENIRKFRTEERLLAVDPSSVDNDDADEEHMQARSRGTSLDESAVPQSPSVESSPQFKAVELSATEQWQKLESEEKQLYKLLLLTRMIAARLFQMRDQDRASELYCDVIATTLPLDELRKLEAMYTARDVLLNRGLEFYEVWRKERTNTSDSEDSYSSLANLLNETAGFSSVSKGSAWSVVLYSLTAAAACREQHWREASQAFYRVSMVYSNMQVTTCAVDSLLDAHWMCCQAEDYLTALQFLYNAFIRALAARDLLRCLRLEQQALHLVDKIKSLGPLTDQMPSYGEGSLDARQQVSTQHVEFLVNMSRATRRKDWAWFEISETELLRFSSTGDGHQADAVLQAVFLKIKKSLGPADCH